MQLAHFPTLPCFCFAFLLTVLGKMPPGKLPPGKLPPEIYLQGKLPLRKLPPGKMPPRKIAPRKIVPMKMFCEHFCISSFYLYESFRP